MPRPLAPNVFVGPFSIQIAANVGIGATFIPLPSIAGISMDDPIGIMLDSGVVFHSTVSGPPVSGGVNIANAMPNTAASGNLFFDYKPEPVLAQTEREDFGP